MFPTIARFQNDVNIDSKPIKLHLRSLTQNEKYVAGTIVVLALLCIMVAAGMYNSGVSDRLWMRIQITLGVCSGVIALTLITLAAKHLHFKKDVDDFLGSYEFSSWSEAQDFFALKEEDTLDSLSTLPVLYSQQPFTGKNLTTWDARSIRMLRVRDKSDYHLIFEKNSLRHNETLFPNIVALENIKLDAYVKYVVLIEDIDDKQKKILHRVIGIALAIIILSAIAFVISGLKTWSVVTLSLGGGGLFSALAFSSLHHFLFKRKVNAFLGGENLQDPTWTNPENYRAVNISVVPDINTSFKQQQNNLRINRFQDGGIFYVRFEKVNHVSHN